MGNPQRMVQMLSDSLSLTADQRKKVDSIYEAYQAKMPAFTPGQQPSDEDRQKRMQITQERTAAVKAVLTAEQQTKFDALMQNMRGMGGGRPRP